MRKKILNTDQDPTEVNISHENVLEGGAKKSDLQVLQEQNCSEPRFLPCRFYMSAAPCIRIAHYYLIWIRTLFSLC